MKHAAGQPPRYPQAMDFSGKIIYIYDEEEFSGNAG